MAIRVTQNTMYNSMVSSMQQNLGAYMESVQQGSTQKKINRPSDDPAGTYRVLTTRNDMVGTAQYQENVDTAKGWLNLADSVLSTNVTTAITGLKTLAEQASTGTYTAEQRMIMADQARQYFGQLLNLSNTQFEDMHLFGGHKYDQPAFQMGLGVTSWDENWESAVNDGKIKVEGSTERTILVQFTGPLEPGENFKWSNDGGATWNNGEITVDYTTDDHKPAYFLNAKGSGVTMTIPIDEGKAEFDPPNDPDGKLVGGTVTIPNPAYDKNHPDQVDENGDLIGPTKTLDVATGFDAEKEFGPNNGTFLYIRPTAIYMGDVNDPPIDVNVFGASEIAYAMSQGLTTASGDKPVTATGTFGTNVLVRVDGVEDRETAQMLPVDLNQAGQEFTWSYSTDGGSTWITAKGKVPGNDDATLRLPVPGGYVDFQLTANDGQTSINGGQLPAGMQVNIHPSRADLNYEIMKDTYLSVNSVGKDVFGGYYNGKPAMDDNEYNLFEVVGSFIGYLEGNSQEGCQKTLAALTKAEQKVLAEATRIGGMENRVEMAADVLSFQKLDQQERLSYTEDVDLTELLTRLTRQQLTYQTVLQSSSMIMKLSLLNYV